ncbi:MAG TPA: pyridoxamine 5'-phosphate oxidase family protein [Candidatus Acidoferrum sp.]|nr:pyridoxamine 5'-phosphate oxidase family protein [Candidatus Acidoferrum sp.]
MRIEKISTKECRWILMRDLIGRLACSREDQPYVVPIYFAYEPDHLYGFTTEGQKIEWMRANPRVCVEVDDIANRFQWESVIITGRFRELPDGPQHAEERAQARKLLEHRSLWWETAFAARQLKSETELIPPVFYCIEIESMTGYRAIADTEEYLETDAQRPASQLN